MFSFYYRKKTFNLPTPQTPAECGWLLSFLLHRKNTIHKNNMAQKWPRVSAQWIPPPPPAAFLNYISQLLLFWELKEIKSHTDHIYSAPILSKGTVLVWWLHIHLFPKSRDSRLAAAGLAEHSTEFCWGCQVRTELNLLSQLNECQLAYSGCKK